MGFIKGCIILVIIVLIYAIFKVSVESNSLKVALVCAIMGSILIINGLIIISL